MAATVAATATVDARLLVAANAPTAVLHARLRVTVRAHRLVIGATQRHPPVTALRVMVAVIGPRRVKVVTGPQPAIFVIGLLLATPIAINAPFVRMISAARPVRRRRIVRSATAPCVPKVAATVAPVRRAATAIAFVPHRRAVRGAELAPALSA